MQPVAAIFRAFLRQQHIHHRVSTLIVFIIDSQLHQTASVRIKRGFTLKEPEEIKLAMQVVVLRDKLEPYFAEGRYQDALVELAELREPVDAFFDKVMVMVDDKELRLNRLTMLEKLRELFLRVADISLLQ